MCTTVSPSPYTGEYTENGNIIKFNSFVYVKVKWVRFIGYRGIGQYRWLVVYETVDQKREEEDHP